MIAVSNTTPLRYLIAIEQVHLLGRLFERVLIPGAVFDELTEAKTPDQVRRRILAPPVCLQVRAVGETPATAFPVALHRDESESILLAEIIRADVLPIDEQAGRSIASSRNLPISGTLGVLERADTQGLVSDFSQTLKRLKASGFYITDVLEKQLLQRQLGRRHGK